eukprot:365303-Chlamydomonas_euryale.AAC.20
MVRILNIELNGAMAADVAPAGNDSVTHGCLSAGVNTSRTGPNLGMPVLYAASIGRSGCIPGTVTNGSHKYG